MIDWKLFHQQKDLILKNANDRTVPEHERDLYDGILNLMDSIQDEQEPNTEESPRFVKVFVPHHYVVPADNEEAIQYARESLYDDLQQEELVASIEVLDAPDATCNDVPDFITEFIQCMEDDKDPIEEEVD